MTNNPGLFLTKQPIAVAHADPSITHGQLRDSLLICPRESGIVNYVAYDAIVEQDMSSPDASRRILCSLDFTPSSLSSLPIHDGSLIAAVGHNGQTYISYHTPSESERSGPTWEVLYIERDGSSMKNSALLTSFDLTHSNESSMEPRVLVGDNDGLIRLLDIPLLNPEPSPEPHEAGHVKLEQPVNQCSISPDGRMLVCASDSEQIHMLHITGGAQVSFELTTTFEIPPSPSQSFTYAALSKLDYPVYSPSFCRTYSQDYTGSPWYSTAEACFSTAFSTDGTKFAASSQNGAVAVWDIRSTKPLVEFHTNKMRNMGSSYMSHDDNGVASGWLSDPWEWTTYDARAGWGVRSVKFSRSASGKEVLAFTEHQSVIHLVDAQTFETHETVRMPALQRNATCSEPKYFEDLDIAGMCFDPDGKNLYAIGSGFGDAPVYESTGLGDNHQLSFGAVAEWTIVN